MRYHLKWTRFRKLSSGKASCGNCQGFSTRVQEPGSGTGALDRELCVGNQVFLAVGAAT